MVHAAASSPADDDPSAPAATALPAPHADALATFRAVTHVPSDAAALPHLRAAAWDLERAVTAFLDGRNPSPPSSPAASTPPAPAPAPAPAPTPAPPAPRPLPRWLLALTSPLRFVWSLFSGLTTALLRLFTGGPLRALEAAPGPTSAARFLSFYEARHGTSHPPFFEGSYLAALSAAQSDLHFVLVYIHSESHRLTPRFCADVLAAPSFISAAAPLLCWAGSVSHRDAAAVAHALRAPGLPFLAVVAPPSSRVDPTADVASASNFGTVLAIRAGYPALNGGGDGAAAWLGRVLQRHGGMLVAAREQREERESARLLREQQDEEYAAALVADRERERQATEELQREEGERKRALEREVRRERKREALGDEPDKGPGIASVVVRLPDGSRAGRRFAKDDALEKVFDWAEVNRIDIEVACLVTSYPRRSLKYPEDAGISVEQAGLFPSAMLLLEERAEE